MAAPHVTGLAALVLAHHPDFQGSFKIRNAQRVDRLFEILRQSARPLNFGDRNRTGAGVPDCLAALQLQTQSNAQSSANDDLLQRLMAAIQGSAPVARTPSDLRSAMQDAGLLPANGAGASPQMSPASAGPMPTASNFPSMAGLQERLRAAMQEAGLLAGSGEPSLSTAAPGGKSKASETLADSLRRAGLL